MIVGGVRTPFVRAFTDLLKLDAIDLSVAAARALLEQLELPHKHLDAVVWGGVILPSGAPNVGREVVTNLKKVRVAVTSRFPIST